MGAGDPLAATVKDALCPAAMAALAGCAVIAGAVATTPNS
jgi:hypothetical protein